MGALNLEEKQDYSKGLEGIVAGETRLSLVDGQAGRLYYAGIPVEDLISGGATFEEVVYLLWFGKLPNRKELTDFSNELAANRDISPEIHSFLTSIPKKCHPMAMLRSAVSCLALYDPEADNNSREANLRKGVRILAQLPTIIASFDRIRHRRTPIIPVKDLSHAANFLYLLTKRTPNPEHAKALDQYLILLADHGYNASTFAARVTVSTLSDIYSGVVSAIGTLKGDLHGSANQHAMEMILEIGEASRAEAYVKNLLNQKKKIMGFGHRIYKHHDPRALVFKEIAKRICRGTEFEKWYQISEVVEAVVEREKHIPCNVDFYSASVLYAVGIPIDLFTTIFALSRVAGWTAHTLEQLEDNRLIRPEARYTGRLNQPYVPISQRG